VILLIVAAVLASFAALNAATWFGLRALHPRKRNLIAVIVVICNLFWIGVAFIRSGRTTTLMRFARSILGPPWFIWLMFVILYASFLLLLVLLWALRGKKRPFSEFGRKPSTIFLSVLGIAFVAGFFQALVPLRVETVQVTLHGLPRALEGTRIAQISDLHVGMFTRPARLRQISAEINVARPDLLVITGDMIDDDPFYVPKLMQGLSEIDARTRILAVLGNHEMYGAPFEVIRQFRGKRAELLVNRGVEVKRNGGSIWMAGLSDSAADRADARLRPDLGAAMEGRPASAIPILISHQPTAFDSAQALGIPLTICGHTHGGQFGFRPLRWTLAGVFLPYHIGLYRSGTSQLYVNTGTGYWVVPFRLGLSPEITILVLRGSS